MVEGLTVKVAAAKRTAVWQLCLTGAGRVEIKKNVSTRVGGGRPLIRGGAGFLNGWSPHETINALA